MLALWLVNQLCGYCAGKPTEKSRVLQLTSKYYTIDENFEWLWWSQVP